jgi:hypothetical protein
MKKLFWPMLAWLSFCVFAAAMATPANARIVDSFKLGAWRGDAFVSDQTGKFDSCVAIARYRNNISMSVQVDANYSWWIGFSAPGWTMTPGEKIGLRYRIDRGSWQQGTAVAVSKELARLPMPAGGYIIKRFRRGRVLTVHDGVNTYRFKLSGTSRLLARLATCVQKNAGIYGTAPAASGSSGDSTGNAANATSPFGNRPGEPELIVEASQALFNLMGHLDVRGINLRNEKNRKRSLKGIHAVATNDERTLVAHIFGPGRFKSEQAVLTSVIAEAAKNCEGDFSSGTGSRKFGGATLFYGNSTCLAGDVEVIEYYAITKRQVGGIYAFGISDTEVGEGGGSPSGPPVSVSAEQFQDASLKSSP